MSFVLSLIADPEKERLDGELVARACACLVRIGARPGGPDWLSREEACEIPFDGDMSRTLPAVREALRGRAVDVNAVPGAFRRKKLLLADMDSTLIEQECIDELAAEAGSAEAVAEITARADAR
jgi:phosphoserine phosphatase